MVVTIMRVSDDLKNFINTTQQKLKKEIYEHHAVYKKLKRDPKNPELEKKLKQIQGCIQEIGDEQQFAIHRLKLEVRNFGKQLQYSAYRNSILERTNNINNALQVAATKIEKSLSSPPDLQLPSTSTANDVASESAAPPPPAEISEESLDMPSVHSPEPSNPLVLEDLTQTQFLKYFGIVTHTVHDEMQKKRIERKRRSTANPQFFYGTKWDYAKRKRGGYLMSNMSPPQTRQTVKNKLKAERSITPPSKDASPHRNSPVDCKDLLLPTLPQDLTIERIDTDCSNSDIKLCTMCSLPGGSLSICESCTHSFHVSCHDRPLVKQPKLCPRCIDDNNMEVSSVTSERSSTSTISSADIKEKLKLHDENKMLLGELQKLQEQHTQLTVLLKQQELTQKELLDTQVTTRDKIKNLLIFITRFKSPLPINSPL